MSSDVLSKTFARFSIIYCTDKVKYSRQIVNIDVSAPSTRTVLRAPAKDLTRTDGRCDSAELKWSNNFEHVTMAPVVSAEGKVSNTFVILQGSKPRFRNRVAGYVPDGYATETPPDFLTHGTYIANL